MSDFAIGDEAVIHGLTNKTYYNDRECEVIAPMNKAGRVGVRIPADAVLQRPAEDLAVKPSNLRRYVPPEPPTVQELEEKHREERAQWEQERKALLQRVALLERTLEKTNRPELPALPSELWLEVHRNLLPAIRRGRLTAVCNSWWAWTWQDATLFKSVAIVKRLPCVKELHDRRARNPTACGLFTAVRLAHAGALPLLPSEIERIPDRALVETLVLQEPWRSLITLNGPISAEALAEDGSRGATAEMWTQHLVDRDWAEPTSGRKWLEDAGYPAVLHHEWPRLRALFRA